MFCPVFDVGEAYTRRHGFEVLSNIIKILRGKYKAESYWFQAVQHIKLYGFQAAKRLTLPDIADWLVWLQSMILNSDSEGNCFTVGYGEIILAAATTELNTI